MFMLVKLYRTVIASIHDITTSSTTTSSKPLTISLALFNKSSEKLIVNISFVSSNLVAISSLSFIFLEATTL